MAKRTIPRFYYPLVLGVLGSLALFAFGARRFFGIELIILEAILSVLAVLALGLGYWAAKTPREIPSFGDPVIDAEIDTILQRRAAKTKNGGRTNSSP
jgi:hypothetical protein